MSLNKRITAIYNALDTHQFTKVANKLTSKDDHVILLIYALRAHALEKCGRLFEAVDCLLNILHLQLFPDHEWLELVEKRWHFRLTFEENDSKEVDLTLLYISREERQQILWKDYLREIDGQTVSNKTKKKKNKKPISTVPALQQLDDTLLSTCAVSLKSLHGWQTLADMFSLSLKLLPSDTGDIGFSAFMSQAFLHNWSTAQGNAMKLKNRLDYCSLAALNQSSPLSMMLAKRFISNLLDQEQSNITTSYEYIRLQIRALEKDSPEEALHFLERVKQQLYTFQQSSKNTDNNATGVCTFHDEIDFTSNTQGRPVSLQQVQEWQVQLYLQIEKYDTALKVLTEELLQILPNQWSYWTQVLTCLEKLYTTNIDEVETNLIILVDAIQSQSKNEKMLRGPQLILLEMKNRRATLDYNCIDSFVEATQAYIESFSSKASCCFQDVRTYILSIVDIALKQDESEDLLPTSPILQMLRWTKEKWPISSLKNDNIPLTLGGFQTFICAIQVAFQLIARISFHRKDLKKHLPRYLSEFSPSLDVMIQIYESSLSSTPANNKKQVLPGDNLILCTVQKILAIGACQQEEETESAYFNAAKCAAGLLERAIEHSPFNSALKLTGIQVYFSLGAVQRCWELYTSLDIKQIQLDSSSHVILMNNILQSGGFYGEVCEIASSIIKFHKNLPYNIYEYSSRAMSKGHMSKACEMLSFLNDKIKKSIILIHAQHLLLEYVPTTTNGLTVPLPQAEQQFKQLLHQSQWDFAAPSLFLTLNKKLSYTDNRDMDIFQFEILQTTIEPKSITTADDLWENARISASIQSILMHSTLLVASMKTSQSKNYKKVTKRAPPHVLKHAKCLFTQLRLLEGKKSAWEENFSNLANALFVAATGFTQIEKCEDSTFLTINEREEKVVSILNEITINPPCYFDLLSVTLPRYLVPFYNLLNIIGTLFQQQMGWGRQKTTKMASIALKNVALQFRESIVKDALAHLTDSKGCGPSSVSEVSDFPVLSEEEIVLQHIAKSKQLTKERILPIFESMKNGLDTFDVDITT